MGDGETMHLAEHDLATLHDQSCTTDGSGTGACLTAHAPPGRIIPEYNKNHSCSYRWQAHQVSLDERRHLYDDAHLKGVPEHWAKRVYTDAKRQCRCLFGIPLPEAGDWDLDGPSADRVADLKRLNSKRSLDGTTTGGVPRNFVSNAQWPYFFNCHHLIPKGLFNRLIDEQAALQCTDAPSECAMAIRYRLLKAKYNINHKVNMMILPNTQMPAGWLGLPRHLTRKPQPTEKKKVVAEFRSHAQYDKEVRKLLEPKIRAAAQDFAKKRCQAADLQPLKADLESISRRCFSDILKLGKSRQGGPLAMISLDMEE
jgi:hypothetical protein